MWLELEDAIRLRVKSVKFRKAPNAQQLRSASEAGGDMLGTAANPFAPMQVCRQESFSGTPCKLL